jgi:hypothetical protein
VWVVLTQLLQQLLPDHLLLLLAQLLLLLFVRLQLDLLLLLLLMHLQMQMVAGVHLLLLLLLVWLLAACLSQSGEVPLWGQPPAGKAKHTSSQAAKSGRLQ